MTFYLFYFDSGAQRPSPQLFQIALFRKRYSDTTTVTTEDEWRIGTHMRSTKRCHFQWSWVIHYLDLKVTILFNVKQLI